jgi:predicted alpha/beta-hydrolase family hydrolase
VARSYSGECEAGGKPFTWTRTGPLDGRPLVFLAHGAGAPMTHPFMQGSAEGLVERGLTVARFNFPYMTRRALEDRKFPPDRAPVLLDTWRAMLNRARKWKGAGPIVIGGKSMGGRMASMLLAEGRAPEVRGVFYLGYPLHPPGKPEKLRDAHLPEIEVPQLFISGTKDPLCDLKLLRPVLKRIGKSARLVTVEKGDHSLALTRKDPMRGSESWLDEIGRFVMVSTDL